MLERARPGDRTILRDVADEEGREAAALRQRHETSPALAHLRHAARSRLEAGQEHRLDGVDHERTRLHLIQLRLDHRKIVLRPEEQPIRLEPKPFRAQPHLRRRFLRRDVQDGWRRFRERSRRLQEQRALADARLSPDEHERPWHDAAAQDAIELANFRAQPGDVLELHVAQRLRPAGRQARPPTFAHGRGALLDERDELTRACAVGTRPRLGAREAALLTAIGARGALHHCPSLPSTFFLPRPRMKLRRRKLREAPSRMLDRRS